MDRDLVSPGPSLTVEPSAHSGEEETELSKGSAAMNLGLLFPASAVTLLGSIDAASFIRLPGQVLLSNMDSSPLACLALHCSPSPSWSSALVADCPPYIPSCTFGLLREQSHMLGPIHHLSTQGHHSPSQPLALPLCSQCARSLPIHLLRTFPMILCLPTQTAPQGGHSQAPT